MAGVFHNSYLFLNGSDTIGSHVKNFHVPSDFLSPLCPFQYYDRLNGPLASMKPQITIVV